MDERIEFREADALALPFADGTFDHVWCHNVTMNIPDNKKLALEVARVLKRVVAFPAPKLGKDRAARLSFLCLGQPTHRPASSSLRR